MHISRPDYCRYLWEFRGDIYIEDPEEDIDSWLRWQYLEALDRKDLYQDYLMSDYWSEVRDAMLLIHDGKCQGCGADKNLQVHHKRYTARFSELDNLHLLELLCEACHGAAH